MESQLSEGGTTAVPSLSPMHDRSKIKTKGTRLNHSCPPTRKLKLELVLYESLHHMRRGVRIVPAQGIVLLIAARARPQPL